MSNFYGKLLHSRLFTNKGALVRSVMILLLLAPAAIASPRVTPSSEHGDAQSFPLKKVRSIGSKLFSEADIVKATGLKIGSSVTRNDLQEAADRLGQSGVFTQVTYRYDGETVEFALVDAGQFLPVTFENFVWFSDAELIGKIHNQVPLFNGVVPLSGNLGEQISSALDSILKEKNIPGRTTLIPHGELGGPIESIHYQIDGIAVKLAEVRFPGATPEHAALLAEAVKELLYNPYMRNYANDSIQKNGVVVYNKLGFLKAQFAPVKAVILKDDPSQPVVAVEVQVDEGDLYTFLAANWTGVAAVPVALLATTIDLKAGSPANAGRVVGGVQAAEKLYASKGYLNAQIKILASLDAEKHTATFNLAVTEGPIYHLGKLDLQGPDAERTELIRKVWEMREGDVYDTEYINIFVKRHNRELQSLSGYAPRFTQAIHDDTHLVDLSVKFEKFQREAK
jgi:outer membrane protein assembly factor BamA